MYYRVYGNYKGTFRDKTGQTVSESTGTIIRTIQAETPEQAAEKVLNEAGQRRGYADYCWLEEPEVTEAPADTVMKLIGAERLPGF